MVLTRLRDKWRLTTGLVHFTNPGWWLVLHTVHYVSSISFCLRLVFCHMIEFTVVTRNMLQIHWIFESRGNTLTPPPSDFTTNPRNQADFSMDNVLSFKRFRWNSFVLKCDHRLCESPATPQNSRWLLNLTKIPPKNSDRVDFQHMIQFTVVTRKPYDFVSNPMKKLKSRRASHAPTKRFQTKCLQPDRLCPGYYSHFQAFWTKFNCVEMRSSLMWISGDSPKQQMTPKKFR